MNVAVSELESLVLDVLGAAGVPAVHARIQADVLLEAELRGHPSHGLLRVRTIVERIVNGVSDPRASGRHDWRAPGLLTVDGEGGLGPVVGLRALEAIGGRARDTGIAVAALRRSNHLGMLAWYVERAARGGQLAMATCTSEALVHPWGGAPALLGTNPLAIGVPAQPRPLVLDMSTGRVSRGKILEHARRGAAIPPDWAVDAAGRPTTDPGAAAAISPFGGAKGYALGLALEVLVATLTATALGRDVRGTLDSTHESTKGDVFIVLDVPDPAITVAVSAYLQTVREAPRMPGYTAVAVPGDRAAQAREDAARDGIEVADATLEELRRLQALPIA